MRDPDDDPVDALVTADGRLIDRGCLAAGGVGSVRAVWDGSLTRDVAVKVLREELVQNAALRSQLLEEARIAARLDHPNTVPVHDVGVDERGRPYFVMKLVRGRTLDTCVHTPLAEGETRFERTHALLDVILRVCEAVAHAHSLDLLHCDLKPGNVMVGDHGAVYVMDWGIARRRGVPFFGGGVSGTAAFMSPEQARGDHEAIRETCDVYGLGGLLYYALTGQPPHAGDTDEAMLAHAREGVVEPPDSVAPHRPPAGLCAISMRALSADPRERYPTVAALQHDLRLASRGGWWLESRSFPAGEVIVREGEPGDEAFIITEGICEAHAHGGTVVRMRAGETFGELSLLVGKVRAATVVARTPLTVRVITREAMQGAIEEGAWEGIVLRSLAARFRELAGR